MLQAILDKLVRSVDTYLPFFTLCVYLWLWKKIRRQEILLLFYLIINVIFGSVTNVMGFFHINNLALYHFYTLFEQWFVSYYLTLKIAKEKFGRLYFIYNIAFTIFWAIDIALWEPFNTFNSITQVISNLILLLLCMYYILDLAKKDEILYFQKLPSFWIVSSFLTYSALSLLILAVYTYYVRENQVKEGNKIWHLMYFTATVKFILMSTGLLCYKKPIAEKRLVA